MLDVLRRVACGELTPEEAAPLLRADAVMRLGDAVRVDLGRQARTGIPEVVLAAPKRPAEVAAAAAALLERTGSACVSRMRSGHRTAVAAVAAARGAAIHTYGRRSVRLVDPEAAVQASVGRIGLLAAGTSDLDALEEARMVCDAGGCATELIADAGVAGLHRLLEPLAALLARDVDVLVVAAGMDGALPSVVSGLCGVPVIGLPVSTGYGAGGRGRAALLAMLQTCAPGLVVVNVGNGVGAGAAAVRIARGRSEARTAAPSALPRTAATPS